MRRHPWIAGVVLLALGAGCGGEGGGGGDAASILPVPEIPAPVPEVNLATEAVPPAAAASDAVDLATEAATHVILDDYTQGEATGAGQPFLSPPEFEFTSHVEFEIDLDSVKQNGDDRFPNVSGILLVTKDGVLQGTWMSGEASFTVDIEAGTDITAVDPDTGIETMIPEGSSWSCSLVVTWDVTDSQNWTVIATSTRAVDVQGLTVTDGDSVLTVNVSGGREAAFGIARIDGEVVKEKQISGSITLTVDDGQTVVEVVIEFQNDGLILVTIDGEEFGPFTPQEFRAFVQDQIGV